MKKEIKEVSLEEILKSYEYYKPNMSMDKLFEILDMFKKNIPMKPNIGDITNSNDAFQYANMLREWEIEVEKRFRLKEVIDKYFEEFIKKESDFNKIVPTIYKDKIYSIAYRNGKDNGYIGIYRYFCELVDIFRVKQ